MKADLHVHSKFSKRPSQWLLQKLNCPESFTEPLQLYQLARARGMTLVTVTDHNTIGGALEIAHLPDTFISEEITTYFPEDGCKIHVLAYDIDEGRHNDIQKVRENIFHLVAYLQQEKIFHVLAHPLYSVNDRLTADHFEQLLLLFKNFEINGARDEIQNECLRQILFQVTYAEIDRLADKHGIAPGFPEPWAKNLTGGSDDHSSLNIARRYTQVAKAKNVQELLHGIDGHRAKVAGLLATPRTMAHNLYGIAYQFYKHKLNLGRHVPKDIFLRFLDRSLHVSREKEEGMFSKLYCMWNYRRSQRKATDRSISLQQNMQAAVKTGKKLTVITCDAENHSQIPGVQNFVPVGVYELPVYQELKLFYPPLLEMLNYCYEQGFTGIHSATPGPIGLAALAIAKILKVPISGTYHTSLPQYANYLTGDADMEDLMWHYVLWYYDQMHSILVPSSSTGTELQNKGVNPAKIRLFPRGIDIERFHPAKRNGFLDSRYGMKGRIKLLYVGRVSREKNMQLLVQVFRSLIAVAGNVSLIVVGEGPYLQEMQQGLESTPTLFTGHLQGDALAETYASCDLFLFPSITETFGNVVLEAQASGLPVIVTDCGGPKENLIPGKTGVVAPTADAHAILRAVLRLIDNPAVMRNMGKEARRYMEGRSFEKAFEQTWQIYEGRTPEPSDLARAV